MGALLTVVQLLRGIVFSDYIDDDKLPVCCLPLRSAGPHDLLRIRIVPEVGQRSDVNKQTRQVRDL